MENIYVAIFNCYEYETIAKDLQVASMIRKKGATVSLINEDTLCIKGLSGQELCDLMEENGYDYNYSYISIKDAWNISDIVGYETETGRVLSLDEQLLNASISSKPKEAFHNKQKDIIR